MIDFRTNPHLERDYLERVSTYQDSLKVFKAEDQREVLARLSRRTLNRSEQERHLIYIAVNLAGLISRKVADFLVGESPAITGQNESDEKTLSKLAEQLQLNQLLYETALSQSWQGDVIWRLRVADGSLVLEEIPASNYLVRTVPGNNLAVTDRAIAYQVKVDKDSYLRVEHHEPGRIIHEAWALDGEGRCRSKVSLRVTDGDLAPEEVEETRISRPLLFHIHNFKVGTELWSINDYKDLVPLFDAINNRLSSIDRILGRHSNPKLTMPGSLTDGTIRATKDLLIVNNSEEAKAVGYVTWDGHLKAAFDQLTEMVMLVLHLAEMSLGVLGLDKSGIPASGKALRLGFISTEHKVNRKKLYFDPQLKAMLTTAAELGAAWGIPGIAQLQASPKVAWQDGLPKIFSELAEDLAKLKDSDLVSTLTALMQLFDLTLPEAEAEYKRITEERKAAMPAVAMESFENGGPDNQDE